MNALLQQPVEEMAGLSYPCSCGKTHNVNIKKVRIGNNILPEIEDVLLPFQSGTLLLMADVNTYEAGGRQVENILKNSFRLQKLIFSAAHLVPDESALEQLQAAVTPETTAIVAVGSGTLNDLARYLSFQTHIPYVIVCTAPSMDGYASMVSPLITKGLKITYPAVYPYAIIADVAMLKDAPLHMLHAGLGDIAGKYTALADWKMANLLHDEYYCEVTVELVQKAIQQCMSSASGLRTRAPESIQNIIEGLILSGMCIGMTGNSRPASGEEHHLSHTWEMMGLINGRETHLHGNQVGIGTEIILQIYDHLANLDIHKVFAAGHFREFTRGKWEENINKLIKPIAGQLIRQKESYIHFDEAAREITAKKIVEKWPQLKESVFPALPSPAFYREIMEEAGSYLSPKDIKLDRESFRLSLIVAKDVRQRYGVLQLLEDLGILNETAEIITDIYYR